MDGFKLKPPHTPPDQMPPGTGVVEAVKSTLLIVVHSVLPILPYRLHPTW
jgi:hypothetical protein